MVLTRKYKAFGFQFSSPVDCPAVPGTDPVSNVHIRYGDVPEQLTDVHYARNRFQAGPNNLLLKDDSVGKYWVKNGNHIVIQPRNGANPKEVQRFLLSSAFAGLLHQRGFLLLHAAAINLNNQAILMVGPSGAGKSTLACALYQQHKTVLTDDLCALKIDSKGRAHVYTGFRQVKINVDITKILGISENEVYPLGGNIHKLGLKLPMEHFPVKTPIRAIFGLDVNADGVCKILPVTLKEKKLQLLIKHTFRKHFLKGFGSASVYLEACQMLSKNISFYQILRPKNKNCIQEIIDQVYLKN